MNKTVEISTCAIIFVGILSSCTSLALTTFGKTFFNHRSQGVNIERWMVGQALHTHLCNTDCMNGSLSITPYYSQTFNSKEVGGFFFGTSGDEKNGNLITFGPDTDSANIKIFSRNLFLNDDYRGIVRVEPLVRDFVLDLNLYVGLDEWVPGLHFRIDIPINWTRWDMRLTETIANVGSGIALNKLGNTDPMHSISPRTSAIQAFKGQILNTTDFPDLKQTMNFARIDGKQDATHVADITFLLGYDFICNECGHFGVNLQVVAPTGNTPEGKFVFEPISGNGHHVAFGAGFSGRWELWNNGCDQSFSGLFEGAIYHLFSTKQRRTFDLKKNGILSRYLLIKKFDGNVYAGEILFGPNVLTREVKVKNDAYGEAILMFDYQHCGFTFDVGYALWGRTKDKLTITENIPANTFGIQGNTDTAGGSVDQTQSLSTINGVFAPAPETPPVFITTDDLDILSAAHPSAVSHKLFTHFAYTWENCDYLPYLGGGGAVEFSGRGNRAFDRWEVWVKGGFTFA